MKPYKILLVSPPEPSGVTWLINCFLHMDICCWRSSIRNTWKQNGTFLTLNDHENILKKWLPILSDKTLFTFRDEIECEWTHKWPCRRLMYDQCIFFIRDPRDSLFSRYKRLFTNATFKEYVHEIDCKTLVDRIDTWALFAESWVSRDNVKIYKFEHYKENALSLLKRIVSELPLNVSQLQMQAAVDESSFVRASESEKLYIKDHPEDRILINRSGSVGGYIDNDDQFDIVSEIKNRIESVLARFEYVPENKKRYEYPELLNRKSFLKNVDISDELRQLFTKEYSRNELLQIAEMILSKTYSTSDPAFFDQQKLMATLHVVAPELNFSLPNIFYDFERRLWSSPSARYYSFYSAGGSFLYRILGYVFRIKEEMFY